MAWATPSLSLSVEQVAKHSCRLANDALLLRRGSRNGDPRKNRPGNNEEDCLCMIAECVQDLAAVGMVTE